MTFFQLHYRRRKSTTILDIKHALPGIMVNEQTTHIVTLDLFNGKNKAVIFCTFNSKVPQRFEPNVAVEMLHSLLHEQHEVFLFRSIQAAVIRHNWGV